jgi:hypothetical protein
MVRDLRLKPTVGSIGGMSVQFAEGRWPGEVGAGLALSDEAFDLVEPHLRGACPGWTAAHRYGVFELPAPARARLAEILRRESASAVPRRTQTTRRRICSNAWPPGWQLARTPGSR